LKFLEELHLRITFLLETIAAKEICFIFRLEWELVDTSSTRGTGPVTLVHLARSITHTHAIALRFAIFIVTSFTKDFTTWSWLEWELRNVSATFGTSYVYLKHLTRGTECHKFSGYIPKIGFLILISSTFFGNST
jgi:hypothetical protein